MLLRSLLFVPGNRPNMLEKALGFKPDAFVPDMEDSIPDGEKDNARETIKAHLKKLYATGIPIIPRVNALETGLAEADLAAVVGPYIAGISIGKIYTPEDIHQLDDIISELEKRSGIEVGSIKLVPWIETALSIVHCYDICAASPRIVGVAFGAEDFTHDMGIERTQDQKNVEFARNQMVVSARAAGVLALDVPFFSFKDQVALKADAESAKEIGFKGKFAIHPDQIDTINETFKPSKSQIAKAKRVVAVYVQAEEQGRGSTSLDGEVVDVPVVKRAYALLASLEQ